VSGYAFIDAVTSDLTFTCWGESLAALFGAAAEALLDATLAEPPSLRSEVQCDFELCEPDLELLLLAYLNELVYQRDAAGLLLAPARIEVDPGPPARAHGAFAGERVETDGRALALDVKAATAYGLRVARVGDHWEARATLDV
jgi:SHS2 domain-containing protein